MRNNTQNTRVCEAGTAGQVERDDEPPARSSSQQFPHPAVADPATLSESEGSHLAVAERSEGVAAQSPVLYCMTRICDRKRDGGSAGG